MAERRGWSSHRRNGKAAGGQGDDAAEVRVARDEILILKQERKDSEKERPMRTIAEVYTRLRCSDERKSRPDPFSGLRKSTSTGPKTVMSLEGARMKSRTGYACICNKCPWAESLRVLDWSYCE